MQFSFWKLDSYLKLFIKTEMRQLVAIYNQFNKLKVYLIIIKWS